MRQAASKASAFHASGVGPPIDASLGRFVRSVGALTSRVIRFARLDSSVKRM